MALKQARLELDTPNGAEQSPASTERPATPTLGLSFELRSIVGPDGVERPLGQAVGRILMALVAAHEQSEGAALTLHDLLRIGWPGEQIMASAGANRVYVALAQLRRLGMRDVVERCAGGYRLAPSTMIRHLKHY